MNGANDVHVVHVWKRGRNGERLVRLEGKNISANKQKSFVLIVMPLGSVLVHSNQMSPKTSNTTADR